MKTRVSSAVRRFVEHRWTHLLLGFLLIVTSLFEIATFEGDLKDGGIGAHHGVLVYGLWMTIRSIVDVIEGTERLAPE